MTDPIDTSAVGSPATAPSFEAALRALEDIVGRLESGDVPLDESITLYERGEELRRLCQARLDAAQARIERIVAGPDGMATGMRAFDDGAPSGARPFDDATS